MADADGQPRARGEMRQKGWSQYTPLHAPRTVSIEKAGLSVCNTKEIRDFYVQICVLVADGKRDWIGCCQVAKITVLSWQNKGF
ncbi:MAG: hypothetical protein GXY41_08380 [Phycisphaerae bacterium]|nr:hypothetical protein [Phycisphaerae bacterium]